MGRALEFKIEPTFISQTKYFALYKKEYVFFNMLHTWKLIDYFSSNQKAEDGIKFLRGEE